MFLNKLAWVVGCIAVFGMGTPDAMAQIADINSAINKAGRQRMLSQRMAKFYQALVWGVAPANGAAELEKARKEFIDGYRELESASINTRAIKEELELGKVQWEFFDTALKGRGEKPTLMQNVATTSERILEVMDNATGMYEKLQGGK